MSVKLQVSIFPGVVSVKGCFVFKFLTQKKVVTDTIVIVSSRKINTQTSTKDVYNRKDK